MSFKIICVFIIIILATTLLGVEARRGRSHSSHHRSRHSSSHRSSGSHGGRGFFGRLFGSRKSSSSSSHSGSSSNSHHSVSISSSQHSDSHAYEPHTSHYVETQTHSQPYLYNTKHRAIGWSLEGSRPAHRNSHAANSHISHTWGDHQLKPSHVYVTQPSSMPANAVYYAQPPKYSSTSSDSTDFALGYLLGRSSSHSHYANHHYYHQQQQPQQYNSYSTNSNTDSKPIENVTPVPEIVQNNSTNQTKYWPTDNEITLAPLNTSLIPDVVTEQPKAIFKKPPIVTAQTISTNNLTFELPTATAVAPETPPTNGIICMPWSFNETDATHPENVVTIVKTICFPAPSPPPTTTATTTTTDAPIAADVLEKVSCDGINCPPDSKPTDTVAH